MNYWENNINRNYNNIETDTLFFFSKSANKPAGKGTNEHVINLGDYKILNDIKDWRKILSNFYVAQFVYKNKRWNSVEHAFQSAKIGLVDEKKAEWFSLDSGHPIGAGDGLVARKNRKLVVLTENELTEWNRIKFSIMEDILFSKFSQVDVAKKVLLATCNAVLLHGTRGVPIQRQIELERVRERLRG